MNWLPYILIAILLSGCLESRNNDSAIDRKIMLDKFKQSVHSFRDSIEQSLPAATVDKSLIFSKDDYSFYATRHSLDPNIHLYKEIGIQGNSHFIEKNFYLKNGILELYEVFEKTDPDSILVRTYIAYYRNGKMLSSEPQLGSEELFSSSGDNEETIQTDLNKLKNAIYQKGDFDLVYDSFAHYPKAQYIILSNAQINPYRAAIRIEEPDDFMKMILSNPEKYKGRKLNLKWNLREPFEALYSSGSLY